MSGQIFVISAPSGTGKTTLLKRLLAADPRVRFSISYTTRPPRSGEVSGQDYFFVSTEEFLRLKDWGSLVECVEQFGFWYGTSREWVMHTLSHGYDLVFDVDTRGAHVLKAGFPQATFIFILPPHLEALEERLTARGDLPAQELARRLTQGRTELAEAYWYDYLVVNDQLDEALQELQAIIRAARCRTAALWPDLASRYLP